MDHFCPRCHSGATISATPLAGPRPGYGWPLVAALFPYVVYTVFFTPSLPRPQANIVAAVYLVLLIPFVVARRRLRRQRWQTAAGRLTFSRVCQSCGELFRV